MKKFSFHFQRRLPLIALVLGLALTQTLQASVGFTVSPATVSNSYNGYITLQITGLTSGETVVVQKFLDANTNSVIDAADLLWQQFQMSDGQASIIGGITNINVPGDTDPTSGQITARVLSRGTDPVLNVIGKYQYRLSSPTGLFTPITNPFTITNTSYAQSLTGNVVNHGTNVPNALVFLFVSEPGDDGPGSTVGGTVANNSGGYSIKLPAGTYAAVAAKSNYLGYLVPLPVTVGNGVNVSTNLMLTNATRMLSGRLVDAANPAVGLPGLFTHADVDGLVAIGTSDTNGNFTLPVGPGWWEVGAIGLEVLGYINVTSENFSYNTSTGNVSGLNIPLPKATALFYGTVKDDQDQPIAGIEVAAENDDYDYWYYAFTDENGNYVVGALSGETWEVEAEDEDSTPPHYLFPQNFSTNVNVGQAIMQNFIAMLATNRITGRVQDNQGNPISNVEVYAYAGIGGDSYSTGTYTDADGDYSLFVANGMWTVGASYGDAEDVLTGNYLPPPSQTVGITNNDQLANFTAVLAPRHITGSVKDSANNSFHDVYVSASATISGTNLSVWGWTGANGNYTLGVVKGNWNVRTCCGCGDWPAGYCCPGTKNIDIGNQDVVADFTLVQTGQIVITTSSPLPRASTNGGYAFQFEAASCTANLNWSATNPPAGLTLSPWGQLSGVPNVIGSNYFFVAVTNGAGHGTAKAFSLVVGTGIPDVEYYYLAKLRSHRQTNPVSVILDSSQGPYSAVLGIGQTSTGSVSSAICTLPTSTVKVFPPGSTALELQIREAIASESAFAAAYPPGNYTFAIQTVNDGDQLFLLNLPAAAIPNTPRISNFAAAQAINPENNFLLTWDPFIGGTDDGSVWLIITDADEVPVFSLWYGGPVYDNWLGDTATSVSIPAGTLQAGRSYLGVLRFVRFVGFGDVGASGGGGGVYGAIVVSAQTAFSLTSTVSAAPRLDAPTRLSPTQFRFLLTGNTGQNYTLQKSTNLNSTNWWVLLVTNAPAVVIDQAATNSRAFYRAMSGP